MSRDKKELEEVYSKISTLKTFFIFLTGLCGLIAYFFGLESNITDLALALAFAFCFTSLVLKYLQRTIEKGHFTIKLAVKKNE